MASLKAYGWLIAGLAVVCISVFFIPSKSGNGRRPQWVFKSGGSSGPECAFDGNQVVSFAGPVGDVKKWTHLPPLHSLINLDFFSVQLQNGKIRFISGLYEEPSPYGSYGPEPTDGSSGSYDYPSGSYDFPNGSYDYQYGSYTEHHPRVIEDPGTSVGHSRLIGGGRFEIELKDDRILRFRTAPRNDDFYVFNGTWETPGEDPELNQYMEAFVQIAREYASRCR